MQRAGTDYVLIFVTKDDARPWIFVRSAKIAAQQMLGYEP